MTKSERIKATLEGRSPDRVPYCFWTHLSEFDLDPDKLAENTHAFYRSVDSDLIKTMPNGMYSIEDWGCEIDYSQVPLGGVAKVKRFAVEQPEDWPKLAKFGNLQHFTFSPAETTDAHLAALRDGRSGLRAGWRRCGITNTRRLLVLEATT